MDTTVVDKIAAKIKQHHQLYRFPVKAELWEDIFDQVINGENNSSWNMGNHDVGTDVIGNDGIRYQNKSGTINIHRSKKQTITWSGHRTTSHETLNEKINFISQNHCDKYVFLARNQKEWEKNVKRYYLFLVNASVIDYTKLLWTEKYTKNGKALSAWHGNNPEVPYSAKLICDLSGQLWTTADISCFGSPHIITINNDS